MATENRREDNRAHEELAPFVVLWRTRGRIYGTETTASVSIHGFDSYEWLPGEYFLLHKVDVMIGEKKILNTEIIGWNYETGNYFMHAYDAYGIYSSMDAAVDGNDWVYEGPTEKFIGGFNLEGTVFSGVWYSREKDTPWRQWMDINLERAQ